jgi:hypothetical protein
VAKTVQVGPKFSTSEIVVIFTRALDKVMAERFLSREGGTYLASSEITLLLLEAVEEVHLIRTNAPPWALDQLLTRTK